MIEIRCLEASFSCKNYDLSDWYLNDNKQTVNYPTDMNMEPQEAHFFRLLGVIVATMPHGLPLE